MSNVEAHDKASGYLKQFDLVDTALKYPAELSGGMRQRVAIARQLINMDGPGQEKTQLLLMDEPFSALDIRNTRIVCRMIRTVADSQDRRTIIVVTHDLRAALSVADAVWIMGRRPAGYIAREMDLVDRELAWKQDAYGLREFIELELELATMFATL